MRKRRQAAEEAESLICKVEEHLYRDDDFTESETATLKEVLNAWRGLTALGKAAKWVIIGLGMVAGVVASVSAIKDAIVRSFMQ